MSNGIRGGTSRQDQISKIAAASAAAERGERIVGFYDRYGPASEDSAFLSTLPTGPGTRREREALIATEDARRADMIDNMAGYYASVGRGPARGGQSAIDPRLRMQRDGLLPVNDMPSVDLEVLNALFPTGDDVSDDGGDDGDSTDGPGGPATPRMTEQDILRAAQERLFQSQLQGFQGQRDLVSALADMREESLGSQEQFRKDMASQRKGFLGEQDAKRAERFEAESQEREQRKTAELARQQTQLNQALQASNIDTAAAGDTLASLGIDPGDFADADMSETTAMLYSQNMSAANFINALDGVARQAANFAKDANDQASAAALFGIGQDLSFGLQQVDQLRQQGLMDDAMAMQSIADLERQAREANDMAMANFDVETLRAAQAAAARDRAAAAAQRKTEATAASLGILANVREGYQPTQADLMVLAEADLGGAFLDIGESEAACLEDLALEEAASASDLENRERLMRWDSQLNPAGGPTPANALSFLNTVLENLEDPAALGLDDVAILGMSPQFGLNVLAPEES